MAHVSKYNNFLHVMKNNILGDSTDFLYAKGLTKYLGLMFRSSRTKSIVFEFDDEVSVGIHSWFVFFDFLAVWFDKDGRMIHSEVVKPFTNNVRPEGKFKTLIEIPIVRNTKPL